MANNPGRALRARHEESFEMCTPEIDALFEEAGRYLKKKTGSLRRTAVEVAIELT